MISYLIDVVLLGALTFTSWRTVTMSRELRKLRDAGSDLKRALDETDRTINKAAHTVVSLKHEGLQALRALETRGAEAVVLADRLEDLIERADWHCAGQSGGPRPTVVPGPWATRETTRSVPVSHQPRIVDQNA
ncbi:hypothetical protein [Consotaella aegiceratis]|uniref:hypothetical protein n=1 Tax=Consotaella aegiceratis TaxID=3097961 RepID=UPI002F4116FC